jgi:hypothetical protein
MKKTILASLSSLILALNPVYASRGSGLFSKGSMFLSCQFGLNTMVRTADPFAEPFDTMPFPLGAGLEAMLSDNIGVGGTVMYDQWSDYLGMFGGKWTFRLFRPSLDVVYHFKTEKIRDLDFLAGASLGWSFVSVSNILGNTYDGNLKNEACLAPFMGVNLRFWPDSPGFLGRLSLAFKAAWSVTGHFSGVYGTAGLIYRLK